MRIRLHIFSLLASVLLAVPASGAGAQDFPTRALTIVVPFAPGGVTDVTARLVGLRAAENFRQPVLVVNKPGAAGVIAADTVRNAPADGYTLMLGTTGTHAVNPTLYPKLPYDPQKDFLPVTRLGSTKNVLVVPAGSPIRSIGDIVALARSKPGGLTFASQGIGTGGHLLGEMLKARLAVPLVHVAYKGSGPALTDLLAGRVDLLFDAVITAMPYVREGRLVAIAMASKTRSAMMPEVPTMIEAGYPGVENDNWLGLFVVAGTPKTLVERLNHEFVRATRDPEVSRNLTERGLDVGTDTPEEFAALIREDRARLGKVIREAGIRAD